MQIKLFGKTLFEYEHHKGIKIITEASEELEKSKFLPDFYTRAGSNDALSAYVVVEDLNHPGRAVAVPKEKLEKGKKGRGKLDIKLTPKGVYQLKTLNDNGFALNTNEKYVDKRISEFKDKMSVINKQEYDMRNGVNEISSILIRLENRKKYPEVREFFEKYPYTTNAKIAEVVKLHNHLKIDKIGQFIASLPPEASDAMKEYNSYVQKVCGKDAIYYIIADKKDFQQTNHRKDPILLAQSPFGHVWQILGAWDEEMLLLEDL